MKREIMIAHLALQGWIPQCQNGSTRDFQGMWRQGVLLFTTRLLTAEGLSPVETFSLNSPALWLCSWSDMGDEYLQALFMYATGGNA